MKSFAFLASVFATNMFATPLLTSADVTELRHGLERGYEQSIIRYPVPNGAVGHCMDGDKQGLYTFLHGTLIDVVQYSCTVPLISAEELAKVTHLPHSASIYNFAPWDRLPPTDDDQSIYELDELDLYHRQLQDDEGFMLNLTAGYMPEMTHAYEFAYLKDGVYLLEIRFQCSTREGFPPVEIACSKDKLIQIADKLSRDPTKGETIQAVGVVF